MNYNNRRRQNEERKSKRLLCNSMKKKIETTMIGALSTIEENFGFLWDQVDGKTAQEQELMKELYKKVRSEILDKGNHQARNIDAELAQYEVEWLKYHLKIPVIPQKEQTNE